jgi:anhydro-N-acetylmuramic acid kinase
MSTTQWVLGLMSGTSLDGVDAAFLRTDGEKIDAFGPSAYWPYPKQIRSRIQRAMRDCAKRGGSGVFDETARVIADAHISAARRLPSSPKPQLIAFHGQTIFHAPDKGKTVQLGDANHLATTLATPVIWDFRSADVAAGGEGAPLAPFFHFALAKYLQLKDPVAFLNLGGVGNVTFVDPEAPSPDAPNALLAFDTGSANALINDWIALRRGGHYDKDGRLAASGRVDTRLVEHWLQNAYFRRSPPKSLDRDAFGDCIKDLAQHSDADGAATLTTYAAACVKAAAQLAVNRPTQWILCGGGRRNTTLVSALRSQLDAPLTTAEAVGLDGDMVEAQAFAYLAARSIRGLSLSAPGTTGVVGPTKGGRLMLPSKFTPR